tara:strand:+ start:1010 stop:1354 length:345 start_codon:yes stop_codon:yes gene_type:complete
MIILGWVPFFIPLEVWPQRPLWHFVAMLIIALTGMVLATVYRTKYHAKKGHVCFLNLITQRVRGYKYSDPKNYNFSYLKEICRRFGIKYSPAISVVTIYVAFIITVINFILYLS